MVIVLVAEGRHNEKPGVLGLEFGPVDVQAIGRLFAVAHEVGRRFTEIGHQFGDVATLKDVGAGGLAVADALNAIVGGVLNARIPVVVGGKKDVPSHTLYSVVLEEGIEAFRKVGGFLAAESKVVLHNHDGLPFRMFLHEFQTFDVAHGAAKSAIRILDGLYTMYLLTRDGHALELGLQVGTAVGAVGEINIENGIYVFHYGVFTIGIVLFELFM